MTVTGRRPSASAVLQHSYIAVSSLLLQLDQQRLQREAAAAELERSNPVRECLICFEQHRLKSGIECCAAQTAHFVCDECFQGHVRAESETESLDLLAERDGLVFCPVRQSGCGSVAYRDSDIAQHCGDAVFRSYTDGKEKLIEQRLARHLHLHLLLHLFTLQYSERRTCHRP